MRYDIVYKVQIYNYERKRYVWELRENHLYDFGSTKPKIRDALLELGRCADVKNITVNGIPAKNTINFLMKLKTAKPTEQAEVVIRNIDQNQVLKKI